MLGKRMSIKGRTGIVTLKPFDIEEIACKRVCDMLSDHEVTRYTLMSRSPTIKGEEEWYTKVSNDPNTWIWGIYHDESQLIGLTTLDVNQPAHLGTTGCVIFDKSYWKKGVASVSHIARTWYAVHQLDLKTITSGVLSPNLGSLRALQSVGYFITGYKLGERYVNGMYLHHIDLQFIRPGFEKLILKDQTPQEILQRAKQGIKIAKKALDRGRKEVKF